MEITAATIENTKSIIKDMPKVYISTFESLSVIAGNQHVSLRPKSRELLAYLVCACGRDVPNEEIIRKVLKREPDEKGKVNLRVLWFNLKTDLKKYNIEYIVGTSLTGRYRYADMAIFRSDIDDMLRGNAYISRLYVDNFLTCYDWSATMRRKLSRLAEKNIQKEAA